MGIIIDLSQTEENYIKAIYSLSNHGRKEVSTNAIADQLDTKPASVTDMLKKLSQKKIINYIKYKGVSLTTEGKNNALKIIRKHRLWEVFLVEKLKFTWDEVHDVAEQLEHIKSKQLVESLDKFLGFPTYDPHGDPIPTADGTIKNMSQKILSDVEVGEIGIIVGVKDSDSMFLKHLNKIKIQLGVEVRIIDKTPYDQSLDIIIDGEHQLTISKEVSNNLYISNT